MVDLGTLAGSSSSSALAIDARGQVVCSSTDAAGETRAVLWNTDSDDHWRAVIVLPGSCGTAPAGQGFAR